MLVNSNLDSSNGTDGFIPLFADELITSVYVWESELPLPTKNVPISKLFITASNPPQWSASGWVFTK